MKTTEEMIEVMAAYTKGKQIECKGKMIVLDKDATWQFVEYPKWNWSFNDYRIKPEPHYVPYDSVMEIEENKWVREKTKPDILCGMTLLDLSKNTAYVGTYGWCTMEELLDEFEYADGTPCGKLME